MPPVSRWHRLQIEFNCFAVSFRPFFFSLAFRHFYWETLPLNLLNVSFFARFTFFRITQIDTFHQRMSDSCSNSINNEADDVTTFNNITNDYDGRCYCTVSEFSTCSEYKYSVDVNKKHRFTSFMKFNFRISLQCPLHVWLTCGSALQNVFFFFSENTKGHSY